MVKFLNFTYHRQLIINMNDKLIIIFSGIKGKVIAEEIIRSVLC